MLNLRIIAVSLALLTTTSVHGIKVTIIGNIKGVEKARVVVDENANQATIKEAFKRHGIEFSHNLTYVNLRKDFKGLPLVSLATATFKEAGMPLDKGDQTITYDFHDYHLDPEWSKSANKAVTIKVDPQITISATVLSAPSNAASTAAATQPTLLVITFKIKKSAPTAAQSATAGYDDFTVQIEAGKTLEDTLKVLGTKQPNLPSHIAKAIQSDIAHLSLFDSHIKPAVLTSVMQQNAFFFID